MTKEIDARVLEAFEKVRKKFLFSDVEFKRAIEFPDLTIIACKGKIGSLIGRKGIIVAELSKALDSKVRLVEHSKNPRKVVSDIIGNARLLGISETFSPQGRSIIVRLNQDDKKKLLTKPDSLESAIEQLTEAKTRIEFG